MKKIFIYFIIVLVTSVSFLFAPKPTSNKGPDSLCPVNYIQLNKYMGFSMNCDAIEYMGGSVAPGYLFNDKYSRQSRPLYLLSGSLIGYAIYFISSPFHSSINKWAGSWFDNQIPEEQVSLYLSHYAGLIFLNLLVLVFSLLFFEKIINRFTGSWKNGNWFKYSLMLLLISNHITKTFFWTPHQQMFNTLLPLLCIWLFIKYIAVDVSLKKQLAISFLFGTLLLFYGSFLLLLPILAFSIFYKIKVIEKKKLSKVLQPVVLNSLVFILPLLCWILTLKIVGVDFYSHETAFFREFIWVADAINDPNRNLFYELSANFSVYIKTTGIVIFPIAFLIISYFISQKNNNANDKFPHRETFILTTILLFLFFFFLGYYTDRLTYSLCPLFITYSAILLNRQKLSNLKKTSIIIIILSWHIFILLNEMPHISDRFYY